jgi:hypothetical protein
MKRRISVPPRTRRSYFGAKKIHEFSFVGIVGDQDSISSRAEIDALSAQLEQLKQQGVDSL